MRRTLLTVGLLLAGLSACHRETRETPPSPPPETTAPPQPSAPPAPAAPSSPQARALEVVHEFNGAMPTGVTVSREGRVFVNYPRWEDPITATVVELRDGQEVPYPSAEMNDPNNPDHLFSVQSVVVDPRNRLWALDTGSVNMGPIKGQQWAKLVGIDLSTNKVFRTIRFPPTVVLPTTYLNDVRFDMRRGEGLAFITDSSSSGPNGIIVVDLASGRSWRKLNDHPSTKADKNFVAVMDGEPLMIRQQGQPPKPAAVGADGIALSADGSRLFYCPLSSRALYSVDVTSLADERQPDTEVAKTVRKEQRSFASDGLEADAQGRIYLTDWEHNGIVLRTGENQFGPLISDPRLLWPDTLSLSSDGYLYVTANQLHRQGNFHNGQDMRKKPYQLFRLKVDGTPVSLGR